jgi:transposase
MSKHQRIELTDEERRVLLALTRTYDTRDWIRKRARILLFQVVNIRLGDDELAKIMRCHRNTVANVRRRFVTAGLSAALYGKPFQPRVSKKITGNVEVHLLTLVNSPPPEGHRRWTLRLLADRLVKFGLVDSISHVAVGAWLKNVLKQ